ncbi:hypothetical protein EWM64_g6823 [Hericium alpestre]|uniref:Uncharacterized protein n=1 Tax=Hericium alpestre TaxID=135208 RepID=A0A4Y9ZSH2_9AGAM|nr:hypothetical protein EWM64_g6823 [Hericium alpestre]
MTTILTPKTFPEAASLPIIDIAPWLRDGDKKGRLSTSASLHAACLEYGFFYLNISSYVDAAEPLELARLAHEFFALPQEEKDSISLSKQDCARGYQRLKENVTQGKGDSHEALDFYRPVEEPDKTKPLWGENQWPTIPTFREKYEKWVHKMKNLGLIVMEAMSVGLGMTPEEWQELRRQVDDSFWVMRVIVWEIWTNGLYNSTLHRVIHKGTNYRVSIPFFFEPNFTAVVKPLSAALRIQEGLDTSGRIPGTIPQSHKKYEPTVYGEFLKAKVSGNFATGKGKYD